MRSLDSMRSILAGHVHPEPDGAAIRVTETYGMDIGGIHVEFFENQFWTSRQRKGNSLHEISYRACFKPQLPGFFIYHLTEPGDVVYDPFAGRGTTPVEAALSGRVPRMSDLNPLSVLLTLPRLEPPGLDEVRNRLSTIRLDRSRKADMDLSMFYHPHTEGELTSLRDYLCMRREEGMEDRADRWIRMVATNRLTGHSPGFFSVYTLPPNQAVSRERQVLINRKRDQEPAYRDVKALILKKTRSLLRDVGQRERELLASVRERAMVLSEDAARTSVLEDSSVDLTVTSPPFLNIVQYSRDNWLRCWFNGIDAGEIEKKLTTPSSLDEWERYMRRVFVELYRITADGGWVAFEVGEVRNGRVRLEESVVPLGSDAGFDCAGVLINSHSFTKTSNIWGVSNNERGTNTNRIVLFRKKD